MKKTSNFLLSIFFLGIIGCSTYGAFHSSHDRSVDFNQYKTFAWLPDSGMIARTDSFRNTAYDNDVIRNNAKNYIANELSIRGLLVDVDSPDVLMQLVLLNEKRERYVTDYYYSPPYYPYYYYNPYYHPYYYPYYDHYTYYGWGCYDFYCGYAPVYKETFVRGTITINMFDRKQKKMVWTGSAEGNIYDPFYIEQDIHPAIKKVMKNFPIKPVDKEKRKEKKKDKENAISKR
jgi:hypothetical protein